MVKRLLFILFLAMVAAVLYRVLVPPPLPFEIYAAPNTIFTFGVIHNDSGEVVESRNIYIVKGHGVLSEPELKHRLDSFTCTVLPDTLAGKGAYHISFYRYSRRTQNKHLTGPLAKDITFWANEDYIMSYSFRHGSQSWRTVSRKLMPITYSEFGNSKIVRNVCP